MRLPGKQISQSFSYFELMYSPRNGAKVRCLYENKKMSEKSVFPEILSPEMTSPSFPVSCFGLAVLYPTRSEILRFWYKQIAIDNFFAILISTLWRFYRANKLKKPVIYTLKEKNNPTLFRFLLLYSSVNKTLLYIANNVPSGNLERISFTS